MHSFFTPGTRLPTRVNFVWPKSRNDWPMSNHLTHDTPWTNYHNSENSFVLKQKAVSARITIMQFFALPWSHYGRISYTWLSLIVLTSAVWKHLLNTCCVHIREPHFLVKGRPRCFVTCLGLDVIMVNLSVQVQTWVIQTLNLRWGKVRLSESVTTIFFE